MIAIILISIYAISAALVYLWVRLAHYHKRGILKGEDVNSVWLFLTFCPFVNFVAVFYSWFKHYPLDIEDSNTNFFKPRK